jgi:hypothetical protein
MATVIPNYKIKALVEKRTSYNIYQPDINHLKAQPATLTVIFTMVDAVPPMS